MFKLNSQINARPWLLFYYDPHFTEWKTKAWQDSSWPLTQDHTVSEWERKDLYSRAHRLSLHDIGDRIWNLKCLYNFIFTQLQPQPIHTCMHRVRPCPQEPCTTGSLSYTKQQQVGLEVSNVPPPCELNWNKIISGLLCSGPTLEAQLLTKGNIIHMFLIHLHPTYPSLGLNALSTKWLTESFPRAF